VVASAEVNAFALLGGQVFVTRGMLGFVESEAELAAVLGHEIAHVDLRHCVERYQYEYRSARARREWRTEIHSF
jgi:predicted Zn-dependent protease